MLLTLAGLAGSRWATRTAASPSPPPPPPPPLPTPPPPGVLGRTVSIANTRIFRIEQIGPSVKKVPEEFKIYNIPRRPVLAGDMYLVIAEIGSFRVARLGVEHPIHATPGFWKKL